MTKDLTVNKVIMDQVFNVVSTDFLQTVRVVYDNPVMTSFLLHTRVITLVQDRSLSTLRNINVYLLRVLLTSLKYAEKKEKT